MSSLMPISNNWAITSLKVINTSLTWVVQNFSYNMTKFGERIYSPVFCAEESDFKWCLDLYPNGESDPDYVGLYLHLKDSNRTSGMVKYQFSLLNHRGEVAYQIKWSDLCEVEPGSAWGYDKFVPKSKLADVALNLLLNDTLTIFCEVAVSTGSTSSSGQCKNKIYTPVDSYSPEFDLATDMHELWKSSYNSDVVLIAKDKKFLVHKAILSARSSFFRDMLKSTVSKDINLDAVKINDFDYDVMGEVLRYIYCGKVENIKLHATNLLTAAEKFGLPGLKIICENNFINNMNVLNASSILLLADIHKAKRLKKKAIEFIVSHIADVVTTPSYELLKNSNGNLISDIFCGMAKDLRSEGSRSKRKRSHDKEHLIE